MSEPRFKVGDRVYKVGGDYHVFGVIVTAPFRLYEGGQTLYVVRIAAEGGGYFGHIYSERVLAPA